MVSLERFREMMDGIVEEIPEELFRDLNGGILLMEEEKLHPEHINQDLFIMGEYHRQNMMGHYILLYYGSFMRMSGHLSEDGLYQEIRKVVRHELRHHVEFLAGERDLEVEDADNISRYKKWHKREEKSGT